MFISKYLLRRYVSKRWCIVTYSYSPLIVTNCNNECQQIRKKSQLYKHLLSIINLNLEVVGRQLGTRERKLMLLYSPLQQYMYVLLKTSMIKT